MGHCCCKKPNPIANSTEPLNIWNYNFTKKWISKGAKADTEIQVKADDQKQSWNVVEVGESGGNRLWNIYIEQSDESNEPKLFATYRPGDESVTLQKKGQQNQTFILGVAFTGLFLIKTNESPKGRFLKLVGDNVKVVEVPDEEVLDKDYEWEIVKAGRTTGDLSLRVAITRKVSMNLAEDTRKQWSHHDVLPNDPVPVVNVEQNTQYWKMVTRLQGGQPIVSFTQIGRNIPKPLSVGWESDRVLLIEDNSRTNPKSFLGKFRSSGFVLEKYEKGSNDQFLGISDADTTILAFQAPPRDQVWFPEPPEDENFLFATIVTEMDQAQTTK